MKEIGSSDISNHYCISCTKETQHLTTITDGKRNGVLISFERHCLDCGNEWILGNDEHHGWCKHYHKPKQCKFCIYQIESCPNDEK